MSIQTTIVKLVGMLAKSVVGPSTVLNAVGLSIYRMGLANNVQLDAFLVQVDHSVPAAIQWLTISRKKCVINAPKAFLDACTVMEHTSVLRAKKELFYSTASVSTMGEEKGGG